MNAEIGALGGGANSRLDRALLRQLRQAGQG